MPGVSISPSHEGEPERNGPIERYKMHHTCGMVMQKMPRSPRKTDSRLARQEEISSRSREGLRSVRSQPRWPDRRTRRALAGHADPNGRICGVQDTVRATTRGRSVGIAMAAILNLGIDPGAWRVAPAPQVTLHRARGLRRPPGGRDPGGRALIRNAPRVIRLRRQPGLLTSWYEPSESASPREDRQRFTRPAIRPIPALEAIAVSQPGTDLIVVRQTDRQAKSC